MGAAGGVHRPLSRELVQRLIARKAGSAELSVLLITDPINDVYGGAPSPALAELREAGIEVVSDRSRAVAGLESGVLVAVAHVAAVVGQLRLRRRHDAIRSTSDGSTDHAAQLARAAELQSQSPQADRRGSRRRHARGAGHLGESSRRAAARTRTSPLRFNGALASDIVDERDGVARFSGWRGHVYAAGAEASAAPLDRARQSQLSFITEEAIRRHLIDAIRRHAQWRRREHRDVLSLGSQACSSALLDRG